MSTPTEPVDGCSWPLDLMCCQLPDDHDPAQLARWQRIATRILRALSGNRAGPSCDPVTVRPCGRSCWEQYGPAGPAYGTADVLQPYTVDGQWFNGTCGCTRDCSCTELCELRLDGPVYDIVEVLVDGQPLPPEAYRVDNDSILVRLDGDCWDACQALDRPPTEPGTSAVTYRTGLPLDDLAIAAVSELTCHLYRGCGGGSGGCGCGVDRRTVTRLERQGVTMERADPAEIYAQGRIGLPAAELFLQVWNPGGLTRPSRVYSPDRPRLRTTAWPREVHGALAAARRP